MAPTTQPCQVTGCSEAAVSSLQQSAYCRQHFLETCYGRMEEYSRWLRGHCAEGVDSGVVRRFIADCTRQATDLANTVADLDNLERARLLDVILRAAEMSRELRRSPRKRVAIAVRLRSDNLGRMWVEETVTEIVSRHGALLACRNQVDVGDSLILSRPGAVVDARARVAWRKRKRGGGFEIGIELLGCDNYWELDWSETGEAEAATPVSEVRS